MFEAFYEMSATPFTRGIPSHELYMPPELEEVENRLKYVTERQLFAVLTGDCGTGKTTILRRFADDLDTNRYKFLYISDSKLTPRNFYRILLSQMGFVPKYNRGDAKRQLHEEIEIMRAVHGIQPVCVCDECHLMNQEMLEEIRFLALFSINDNRSYTQSEVILNLARKPVCKHIFLARLRITLLSQSTEFK